jgi:hypothetical protein
MGNNDTEGNVEIVRRVEVQASLGVCDANLPYRTRQGRRGRVTDVTDRAPVERSLTAKRKSSGEVGSELPTTSMMGWAAGLTTRRQVL